MREGTLTLPDGRRLGYGLYGNPAGFPLLDLHGIPGSRREAALLAEHAGREDICFIGLDRPGYGRSSPRRAFHVRDLPGDVRALADHLGLARFILLGYSGGGPFALACGAQIPERIAALGVVSGVGPARTGSAGMHDSNRRKFDLAQRMPWLARALLRAAFSALRRDPARLERQLRLVWEQMPEPDRRVFETDPRFAEGVLAVTRDAISGGVSGWVNEEVLMARPWGFAPRDVRCQRVFLWHGALDRNVPVAMGRAVAEQLPNCRATFYAEEGHLSTLVRHGPEIIATLAAAARE